MCKYTLDFTNKYVISPLNIVICQIKWLYIVILCDLRNEMRHLHCKTREMIVFYTCLYMGFMGFCLN